MVISLVFGNIDDKTKAYFGAEMYEFNFEERYDAVRNGGHAIGSTVHHLLVIEKLKVYSVK